MTPRTCDYVASKDDPESWHGTDSSEFGLDHRRFQGGLNISEWHCPHPPLEQEDGNEKYCAFHTNSTEISVDRQQEELSAALDAAGDGPWDNRPEHRGQFVGATFRAINFPAETLTATDNYGIRFDHAQFLADDGDLRIVGTTFEVPGVYSISFANAEFIANHDNSIFFSGAVFRTKGASSAGVNFTNATFRSDDGDIKFSDAMFKTNGKGDIDFTGVTFRTGNGDIGFERARFRTTNATVDFTDAMFRTNGNGDVDFRQTIFRVDGAGDVNFSNAIFRTNGDSAVYFRNTIFRIDGNGDILFTNSILTGTDFRDADFGETDLRGADLTKTNLRQANIINISVNGTTICKQLHESSQFTSKNWDATARAYHDLQGVFSDHGLVGKARSMYIRERRARTLEVRTGHGWFNHQYLGSRLSQIFTGYGVQIQNLVLAMLALFLFSTVVYMYVGVGDTLVSNVSYSVLAFTVAPPEVPQGVGTQVIMMVETFFGTLSIVLLGYILGNRERF